ncbi:MAG TPA: amidohydrolase family protein [Burkholderiales bacterium]|nr:amidohydrolase family protein [Burkholderiales bacterium]
MIVDMHCHAYPRASAEAVNARLAAHGLAVPQVPAFDANDYLRVMDAVGIDIAVLSLPGAMPDALASSTERLRFARELNDLYAAAVSRHPTRFRAFGRVPLLDGEASVRELQRMRELGLHGVTLPTNVLGRALDDAQFDPFWAEADRLRAVCFLHPFDFACDARWQTYDLLTRIGWPADTTLAVARLVLSGHRDRFPNTTLLLSHLGGMIPTYISRLSWATGTPRCTRSPEEYFRSFYYDTAGEVRAPSIKAVCELVGVERVVYGSDYPYGQAAFSGTPPAVRVPPEHVYNVTLREIQALDLPAAAKDKIYFENAQRLLAAST